MKPKLLTAPPAGVFRGTNIMTPNVLDYFRVTSGYVELSEGRGINHEPIFGVTVRTPSGARLDPDPSQMFWSYKAAIEYIREL